MALRYKDLDITKLTPMMQQYLEIRQQYPTAILFFRLGDFYELFFDDAILASRELEITLTSRDCGLDERAPMAGVPYHAVDSYLERLVEQGYKVAICEQVEDPQIAEGIVKREVIRVITPGTVTELEQLEERRNHFLLSIFAEDKYYGLAAIDLATGDFFATELLVGGINQLLYDEIMRFDPDEIIVNESFLQSELVERLEQELFHLTCVGAKQSKTSAESLAELSSYVEQALNKEERQPEITYLGVEYEADFTEFLDQIPQHQQLCRLAVNQALAYVLETQKALPSHLKHIELYEVQAYMQIGATAMRNLELSKSLREQKKRGSLLWVLDHCQTAMGSRLLKWQLEHPLLQKNAIEARQAAVSELKANFILRQELDNVLYDMNDFQRLCGKLSLGTLNARELQNLSQALAKIPKLLALLAECTALELKAIYEGLDPLTELVASLEAALQDTLPLSITEGDLIRPGFNEEVDYLRSLDQETKQWFLDLELREREATGIKNLKVAYNRVFGYYIEVSKSNLGLVPEHYERKQTLANSERYFIPELKEREEQILGANERLKNLEYEIFVSLRSLAVEQVEIISANAAHIAQLDVFINLANLAERRNYTQPEISLEKELYVENGRHPVVELSMGPREFVPNDAVLNDEDQHFILLTGPNMSGKSTYMRQNALICIMAQMGSFVPADYARIGICDQIFTRIGASDDLAGGESTFMVEMREVAEIVEQATPHSLLILDEIGRGTSTYDGLAIAWAVVEYVASSRNLGARTFFATHYHELTDLEGQVAGLKNFHVAVERDAKTKEINFLHHIRPGAADESYGIEVASLAGVRQEIVERARTILSGLEKEELKRSRRQGRQDAQVMEGQIDLFSASLALKQHDELITRLAELEVQSLTPLDALNLLYELSQEAKRFLRNQ